jgi:hypothetical protein
VVWGCSLVLQSALFIRLFSRRISNGFPFLTNLSGFYPVRSALLYLIFGFINASAYCGLYSSLLLLDILVQACAVFEIASALIRQLDGWTFRRAFIPLAFLCDAAIGTALVVGILPPLTHTHRPRPTLLCFSSNFSLRMGYLHPHLVPACTRYHPGTRFLQPH